MSLLAPARGMPTLSAKDGFSRTSSIRSAGSHRGLWDCDYSPHRKHFLPQDKDTYGSDTSHAEKANFFFKEPRIFQLLGWNMRGSLKKKFAFSACDVSLP